MQNDNVKFKNNKVLIIFVLSLGLFVIDRVVKFLAVKNPMSCPKALGFGFEIKTIVNKGLSFGILLPQFILYFLIFAILAFLIYQTVQFYKNKQTALLLAVLLIIAGAASNLWDRLYFGGVIDFLSITHFSFLTGQDLLLNFADIYISVGVILWFVNILRDAEKKKNT